MQKKNIFLYLVLFLYKNSPCCFLILFLHPYHNSRCKFSIYFAYDQIIKEFLSTYNFFRLIFILRSISGVIELIETHIYGSSEIGSDKVILLHNKAHGEAEKTEGKTITEVPTAQESDRGV